MRRRRLLLGSGKLDLKKCKEQAMALARAG